MVLTLNSEVKWKTEEIISLILQKTKSLVISELKQGWWEWKYLYCFSCFRSYWNRFNLWTISTSLRE